MDAIAAVQQFKWGQIVSLINLEEEKLGLDQVLAKKIADIIAFLANLEV